MPTTRKATPTLQSLTRRELIYPHLKGMDRASILRELASHLAHSGVVKDFENLYRLLQEREELGSTGIGSGVAVPHCKVKGLDEVVLAVGLAEREIDFESVDGQPVRVFFVVLSPLAKPAAHLQSLAAISRWAKVDENVGRILSSRDREGVFESLRVENGSD